MTILLITLQLRRIRIHNDVRRSTRQLQSFCRSSFSFFEISYLGILENKSLASLVTTNTSKWESSSDASTMLPECSRHPDLHCQLTQYGACSTQHLCIHLLHIIYKHSIFRTLILPATFDLTPLDSARRTNTVHVTSASIEVSSRGLLIPDSAFRPDFGQEESENLCGE